MGVYDRVRNFVARRSAEDQKLIEEYIKESSLNRSASNYGDIFSRRNRVYTEIPLMLQDPIISSAVAIVMESAFQPSEDNTVFKVRSPYQVIVEELNAFHDKYNHDETLLTTAFNVLVYGNVPIKMEYSPSMQFERVRFIPDFTRVTPIVVSNRTLGYLFDGKFYDAYEFVYAQHLYYKDLGGPNARQSLGFYRSEDLGESEKKLENEFVLAPSYLSPAVKPWRNIKIIEDALILQRLDVSNYMRIIGVNVGDNVYSKNAIKLLNFYRQILKKVRRVSFDGDGMSSSSLGNEFEVIIPTTSSQSLDIKEIGGQQDVRALRDLDIMYKKLFSALKIQASFIGFCLRGSTPISMLDGTEVPIGDMYKDPASYVGKQVYTCSPEGAVTFAKIKQVMMNRPSTSFVRVHLDSGSYFDVTPDHPCQARDGLYIPAGNLQPGQSLMPLYRDVIAKGYERFKDNNTEKYLFTHIVSTGRPKGWVSHHIDKNKRNNDISNLEAMSKSEHSRLHLSEGRRVNIGFQAKLREAYRQARELRRITTGSPCTDKELAAHRKTIKLAISRMVEIRSDKTSPRAKAWNASIAARKTPWLSGESNVMSNPAIRERQREGVLRSFENGRTMWRQMPEWKELASTSATKSNLGQWGAGPYLECDCTECGEVFVKHYKVRKDGVYNTQGLCCPRCSRIIRKRARRKGEGLLARQDFNHKVAYVEVLDVVEDAYDIEIDSPNHNFALTAGVFVHNSEDAPSSLGESGATQRWDERFGRLVKALRMSVTNSMKQIDVNYLRSKGFDVTESDFTYSYQAASTVEDAERRDTMKTYISAISEIVTALDSLNQAYNKDYVVKELFASALSSTSVDVDKLFTVELKPKKVESSGPSLLPADRIPIYSEFQRLGIISEAELAEAGSTSGNRLITSAASDIPILSYRQYLALGDLLASGKQVNLGGEVRLRTISESSMKCVDRDTVIPISDVLFSSELVHTADNLASGASVVIDNLYLVDGGHYLHSADLYNYLYIKDQGSRSIRVRKVWKE